MEGEKTEPVQKTEKELQQEAMLAKLEAAADKLDKANKRFERNRALAEADKVDKMLDGHGEASGDKEKKGMTDQEYAAKVMKGEIP